MKFEYKVAEWNSTQSPFVDWANNLGKDGWELVQCEPLIDKVGRLCIFKRIIK